MKTFKILSLSGGGIRGIFQAIFINKIQKYFDKPLYNYFDLVCCTSTGAIVGMCLSMGIDIERIVDLYINRGEKLFKKNILRPFFKGPIYNQSILKQELVKIFQNSKLKDVKTKVIVTSASINHFNHKVFTNFHSLQNSDNDLSLVDVILSSTAAPTFFSPVKPIGQERLYVDGGLWANTPSSLGILYANKYLNIPVNNIKLISIGTGNFPVSATIDYFNNLRQYSIKSIRTIFELMFASQSSFADQYSNSVLGDDNYISISANLDEIIALDDAKKAISKLPSLAEQAAEIYIEKFVKFLVTDVTSDVYLQKKERSQLVSDFIINETGLSNFFPTRDYYNIRKDSNSIDSYINTAKNSLIMVSVSLVKGINFDNLRIVLQKKLESLENNFNVIISLLNPHKEFLMESIASIYEKCNEEIKNEILDGIKKLIEFKSTLSKSAQSRFDIRLHNSIPFGSAIIIDKYENYGKIQIETKPYKAPYGKSFAFEVVPIKKDGFYYNLINGYLSLINDGESIH